MVDEETNGEAENLRVLVADEAQERLKRTAAIVVELGHVVVARETVVSRVGEATRRERPDVALVELDRSQAHALELISQIVKEAACPVIAMIDAEDPEFVREAAQRGVFAYIADGENDELQSSLEIVLRRFREYQNLEGAFGRRAMIERGKGILMERHQIDEGQAFEMIRAHARRMGRRAVEVAEAVVDGHLLLPPQASTPPEERP
ncbi:MAG TPA: ANTAR domain-containing protein [Gaiellaceae bacterium]|nr:ANTAR domain-containing protein [Gaiellaceae bacterium]